MARARSYRASPRALVSLVSFFYKKNKEDKKSLYLTETLSTSSSILVFYPEGVARHLCLALSASHSFLDFGEAVGFYPFFASYFILHNSYIKVLVIHRYKSSWRCSNYSQSIKMPTGLSKKNIRTFLYWKKSKPLNY